MRSALPFTKPGSWLWLCALLGAGLIARLWLCAAAPAHGYTWDHFDNIGMGRSAAANGLLRIYTVEHADLVGVAGDVYREGRATPYVRRAVVLPNYPPLAITFFYLQSGLLELVAPPLRANTFTARLIMALVPFLFELVAALAVLLVTWRLAGERAGVAAAALCWCFPPLMMNSTLWGQVDAFLVGPAALACLLLLRRRWWLAGLCLGLAVMLKPQGLILGPLALFGALTRDGDEQTLTARLVATRLLKIGAAAAAVVCLVALPWTAADGLAWLQRCYVHSFLEAFPDTTLFAFNFWYLDALRLDDELVFALDSSVRVLGLSKDAWGRLLVFAALGGAGALCWWRHRGAPAGLVIFSAIWLWSVFIWPTRVHERFIVYAVPFAVVCAVLSRRYWPALLGLLIVGTAEHSWNQWLDGPLAGTLLPRPSVVAKQHELFVAERGRRTSRAPGTVEAPPPLDAFRQQLLQRAAGRIDAHRAGRARVLPWDALLTAISLLSYGAAVAASAAPGPLPRPPLPTGPPPARPPPARQSPSRGAKKKRRRRR